MADINQGVVYTGPGQVEVHDLDYPKLERDCCIERSPRLAASTSPLKLGRP